MIKVIHTTYMLQPSPFPTQLSGAAFLAARKAALCADMPRVGKTGTAIRAADYVFARYILVITTATGRAQWGAELASWGLPRSIHVQYGTATLPPDDAEVVVVGWHEAFREPLFSWLRARRWDVLIPDEAHYACNVLNGTNPTTRTIGLYGKDGLIHCADYVWPLTGTPMPNGAPDDLYPMLRGLVPERLQEFADYDKFLERYCVVKRRRYQGIWRDMVIGGQNLDELSKRLEGFWIRRTQADVGITQPVYSVFALSVAAVPKGLKDAPEAAMILDAAETGDTDSLEMHMGPLRRLTGELKAHAVIDAVSEALEDRRIGKIVLMSWHTDVIDTLATGLAKFGVVGISGRTPAGVRACMVERFQTDASIRVFNGQIQAAGEAIDLSIADETWFTEYSFLPSHMTQAALRLCNHNRKSVPLVRVCALAGSIDERLAAILVRKVSTIRQVMEPTCQ